MYCTTEAVVSESKNEHTLITYTYVLPMKYHDHITDLEASNIP